jgi:tetratricopeptide (TPR) repeat protein
VDAVTVWLASGPSAADVPDLRTLRHVLDRLVPSGPLLVNDYNLLDKATRDMLAPSVDGHGPGVLAGVSDDADIAHRGALWSLAPLADSQVELLLRRWLRNTGTARRLTGVLTESLQGWPGRVVHAVRTLAFTGHLRAEPRGIVLATQPGVWPAGLRQPADFTRLLETLSPHARRVIALAALIGEPCPLPLLADAAGVKRAVVETVREELVAYRDGAEPGAMRVQGIDALATLSLLSTEESEELLKRARGALPPAADLDTHGALIRILLTVRAGETAEIADELAAVLQREECCVPLDLTIQRRLLEIAKSMRPQCHGPVRRAVALFGLRLREFGALEQARALLPAESDPSIREELLLRALCAVDTGRTGTANALLQEGLVAAEPGADPIAFDAWALLASLAHASGDIGPAREAWRRAAAYLPARDLERRARIHVGLAACARHDERGHAEASHLLRAAPMLDSLGHAGEAAQSRTRLGEVQVQLGRAESALEHLALAAETHNRLGQSADEIATRRLLGIIYLRQSRYDVAAVELLTALELADVNTSDLVRSTLHISLAYAYRGIGDFREERKHAAAAAALPGDASNILRAKALVAEADLRSGAVGAIRLLERCERDLRSAGLVHDADMARSLLFEAKFRSGDLAAAREVLRIRPQAAQARLGLARLELASERPQEGARRLELLLGDASLPIMLRISCYAHLASAKAQLDDAAGAREAAVAASALLEVHGRSRMNDLRMHRLLARVFQALGDGGRAVSHRSAAKRCLRSLLDAVGDREEGLRMARAQWRLDPGTRARRLPSVA